MNVTKALLLLILGLNVLAAFSLSFLWSLVNTLQIVVHMPLIAFNFPKNPNLMSRQLMAISGLELLNYDSLNELVFSEKFDE